MSDLIKREDVVKEFGRVFGDLGLTLFGVGGNDLAQVIAKALPSAERKGEWIWDNDAVDWNLGAWICSNCHARNDNIPHSERTIPLRWSGSKFCPNCGARMKGVDDE